MIRFSKSVTKKFIFEKSIIRVSWFENAKQSNKTGYGNFFLISYKILPLISKIFY